MKRESFMKRVMSALFAVIIAMACAGSVFAAQDIKALTEAAEAGDAKAQFDLAVAYDEGIGVPVDDAKAVEWYTKAAEHGHARA